MTAETKIALQQHPLSAAFPLMPDAELDALAVDIEKNGQREKGTMLDGMVLDGWHRYLACERADLPFKAAEFEGADPVSFVESRNLHRRHLTASQRAAAIVAVREWRPAGRPRKGEATSPFSSTSDMAKAAEVTERTIQHAKTAHQAGLGDAVRDGQVSASRAAQVAKLPKAKREKALRQPAAPKAPSADTARLQTRIAELTEELERKQEALEELADTDKSAEAFKNNDQFKEMQVLRVELRSAKRRRDELMRENAELKKEVARWKKKAEKK